jgi:N-acetylneuraminic acid mutarotase
LNNGIHILGVGSGGTTKHSKWDGSRWISVSTLPYDFAGGSAVVYNNEIHILGGGSSSVDTKHYKLGGTQWVSASTLPYDFGYAPAVVLNNGIHILGGNGSAHKKNHYKLPKSFYAAY